MFSLKNVICIVICSFLFSESIHLIEETNVTYKEKDSIYTVDFTFEYEGVLGSRRFENKREDSRLDSLDKIASYIYINTYTNISLSEISYPDIVIDGISMIKPFKVQAKVSKLIENNYSHNENKIFASYSIHQNNFNISKISSPSLEGLNLKDILLKAKCDSTIF